MATPGGNISRDDVIVTMETLAFDEGATLNQADAMHRTALQHEGLAKAGENMGWTYGQTITKLELLNSSMTGAVGGLSAMRVMATADLDVMRQAVGAYQVFLGAYRILTSEAAMRAAQLWARAVVQILAAGPGAPIVIGAIAAGTAALAIYGATVGFAEGGIVERRTLATIGEEGPEIVVPLGITAKVKRADIAPVFFGVVAFLTVEVAGTETQIEVIGPMSAWRTQIMEKLGVTDVVGLGA